MTDQEIEKLYQVNAGVSHADGLRGVFAAGYCVGAGKTTPAANGEESQTVTMLQASVVVPKITKKGK